MGKVFELISDDALETLDLDYFTECQVCQSKNVPLYNHHGRVIDESEELQENLKHPEVKKKSFFKMIGNGIKNLIQSNKYDSGNNYHYDIAAVCEKCLKKGNIEYISEDETDDIIDEFCENPEKSKELLRKTPKIPLFLQYEDWPVHCGELCEFIGTPKTYDESIEIGKTVQMCDRSRIFNFNEAYGDITLEPESLSEVSLFRCTKCNKKLFTWQMT